MAPAVTVIIEPSAGRVEGREYGWNTKVYSVRPGDRGQEAGTILIGGSPDRRTCELHHFLRR